MFKRLFLILFAAFTISAAFTSDSIGQDVIVEMEEMVVTATRTPKKLKKVPASVSVVTRKEIEDRKIQNIDEALKTTVGCAGLRNKGD